MTDWHDYYTEPSPAALGTVIALRLAALAARWPTAALWGDTLIQQQAQLICWDGEPGTVWVWRFAHVDEADAVAGPGAEILASTVDDPLTAGRSVVAGPAFGSLGLAPVSTAACAGNPDQLVTVFDGPAPGVQLYQVEWQDMDSPAGAAAKARADAAIDLAARRRNAVQAARPAR